MRIWIVLLVAGFGTYLTRASFLLLGQHLVLPSRVERALPYVGPAVFAAIVAPPVVGSAGVGGAPDRVPEIVAALAAGLVAWRTGRVTWVLVVGMGVLWVARAVGL